MYYGIALGVLYTITKFAVLFFLMLQLLANDWCNRVVCFSPEQLWILNPKRILKRLDQSKYVKEIELQDKSGEQDAALFSDGTSISSKDCWICYDSDRQDAGPLIQPCQCRGDVSAVHHNCLRRWLVEVVY